MGYSSAQAKAFIAQIAPLIQNEAKERGYKVASPIIAQAILESAAGTSGLGKKYHNYFGLKCGKSWKGKSVNLSTKEEYKVGQLTTIKDNFRVYDSMAEGVAGYFDFINTSRYANLKTAGNAGSYLTMIKNDGYATSSTYVTNNMGVVNKYDLTVWDNFATQPSAYPTLRKGNTGAFVKIVQTQLGFKEDECDGKFGIKTEQAVKSWQKRNGLVVDGVVGPKTWATLS